MSAGPASEPAATRGQPAAPPRLAARHGGVVVSFCHTPQERVQACGFAVRQMLDERYGLQSSQHAEEAYGDPERFEYVVARDEGTGQIVGDLRLDWTVDPLKFTNLAPDFERELRAGARVVDMGGHVERPRNERWPVLAVLFAVFLQSLRERPVRYFYAQTRPLMLRRFTSLGFRPASTAFTARGWKHEWLALAMDHAEVSGRWATPAFREQWLAEQGEPLDARFWALVTDIMPRVLPA
jgi:hypothetical protein